MVAKSRIYMSIGILLTVLISLCPAQPEYANPRTPDPKASEMAGKIQQTLDQVLAQIEHIKGASGIDLSAARQLLNDSKRFFSGMDDEQQAQYCLLQSWSAYYSGNIDDAHRNAAKACRLDATSGDAWVTQVAMALLADKKPMLPRPPKPVRPQRSRPGQMGMESSEITPGISETAGQIQRGRLDFDLSLFLAEAVGKKIEPFQVNCLNGTTLNYQPGDESLCVLFWRKFRGRTAAADNDPNSAAKVSPPPTTAESMPEGEMIGMAYTYGLPSQETPITAFGSLFRAGLPSEQMKFLAVNLDSAADRQAVADEIIKRPQPWAQVIVADHAGGLFADFDSIPPDRPVLMMTDINGSVRYAGPATGFIAPMLLNKILGGVSIPPVESETPGKPAPTPADSNSLPGIDHYAPPADGNSLPQPLVQRGEQTQRRELTEEDKIQAERLLTYAEDVFMQAGKKRVITYKRGVDLCRQVMRSYPATEYAEKARQLLRQVPENQRSRYGITDQELGL